MAAARGDFKGAKAALLRSMGYWRHKKDVQGLGSTNARLAQELLWMRRPTKALPFARQVLELAQSTRQESDYVLAARLHGTAALGVGDMQTAFEQLSHAVQRARKVNCVEEELPALTALAELHRRKREFVDARELLEQVWAPAERGPYVLWHADALNVLVQIERDQGNLDAGVAAAVKAYTLAWCDGPPYAYHYGLTSARKHLQELDAREPQVPPFDESKFEPTPKLELNPKDEFRLGAKGNS